MLMFCDQRAFNLRLFSQFRMDFSNILPCGFCERFNTPLSCSPCRIQFITTSNLHGATNASFDATDPRSETTLFRTEVFELQIVFAISQRHLFFATSCHVGFTKDLTPLYLALHNTLRQSRLQILTARPLRGRACAFLGSESIQPHAVSIVSQAHAPWAASRQAGRPKNTTHHGL